VSDGRFPGFTTTLSILDRSGGTRPADWVAVLTSTPAQDKASIASLIADPVRPALAGEAQRNYDALLSVRVNHTLLLPEPGCE